MTTQAKRALVGWALLCGIGVGRGGVAHAKQETPVMPTKDHWVPAAAEKDIASLKPGTALLYVKKGFRIPGSEPGFALGEVGRVVNIGFDRVAYGVKCDGFNVSDFQRYVPRGTYFLVEKAQADAKRRVTLSVRSATMDGVKTLTCQFGFFVVAPGAGGKLMPTTLSDRRALPLKAKHLACLFDVLIAAPQDAFNPPQKCQLDEP